MAIGPDDFKKAMGEFTDKDLLPSYPCDITPGSITDEALIQPTLQDVRTNSDCLDYLSNASKELRADLLNYILHEYKSWTPVGQRYDYVDAGCIARSIILSYKTGKLTGFPEFFTRCELLIGLRDPNVHEFVVIGMFETIQNLCGWHGVDYHRGFDRWLGPESKIAWHELIDFWERKP